MVSKTFVDTVKRIHKHSKHRKMLMVKLRMLGFEQVNLAFSSDGTKDFRYGDHFVRVRLDDNSYDQAYNSVNTCFRIQVTKYAIDEIIRRMEDYGE